MQQFANTQPCTQHTTIPQGADRDVDEEGSARLQGSVHAPKHRELCGVVGQMLQDVARKNSVNARVISGKLGAIGQPPVDVWFADSWLGIGKHPLGNVGCDDVRKIIGEPVGYSTGAAADLQNGLCVESVALPTEFVRIPISAKSIEISVTPGVRAVTLPTFPTDDAKHGVAFAPLLPFAVRIHGVP